MERNWWKEAVGYQIYLKSFMDSNNDGYGDIKGITEKLDYLSHLGVNLLWICPFYPSPMDDNGYDVSDFYDVNSLYGNLDDFDELISEAKKRDIKIIVDLVINHTSDEHPWFIEAKKSKDNPYHDYYIWAEGKDGREPTNWASFFNGSCWEKVDELDEYYMHIFSKKMPDLNWENPKVRNEIYNVMKWWIERGIDGFRIDAIAHIFRNKNWVDSDEVEEGDKYAKDWAKFSNLNGIHDYIKEMNEEVISKHDIATVGEVGGDASIDEIIKYSGYDSSELNMTFTFDHTGCVKDSEKGIGCDLLKLKKSFNKLQNGVYGKAWLPIYWLNHDHPRLISRYGDIENHDISSKMLATALYFKSGTPFIYYGEEIGMTNYPFKDITDFNDVAIYNGYNELKTEQEKKEYIEKNKYLSRDNARTAMQWSTNKNAGFSKGDDLEVRVNPNYFKINVEDQLKDQKSVLNFYRKIIDMRKNSKYKNAMIYGEYEQLLKEDENIYAYIKTYEDISILVLCNFSNKEVEYSIDINEKKELLNNYDTKNSQNNLRPYEAVVFEVVINK